MTKQFDKNIDGNVEAPGAKDYIPIMPARCAAHGLIYQLEQNIVSEMSYS